MRKTIALCLAGAMVLTSAGCGGKGADSAGTDARTTAAQTTTALGEADAEKTRDTETTGTTAVTDPAEEATILVAAVASPKYSYEDGLILIFKVTNPGIKVEGTFDSSGKLQTQIEEGLGADVLMSATMKQMNALKEGSMIDTDSIMRLLENKIVLITSASSNSNIESFEGIIKDETVAIGSPESVPANQYAKEALTTLGLWGQVEARASLDTNAAEVLSWVAEGSADTGVAYAIDTATNEHTKVMAEAPEGSLSKKVIYPVGIVTVSEEEDAARKFVEFLQSDEATTVSGKYDFIAN